MHEELSNFTPLPIFILVLVPSCHFDGKSGIDNKGEFEFEKQVYTHRKKQGAQEEGGA